MQIKDYFQKKGLNRLLILALLILIVMVIRDILNLVLITFIMAFLMNRIQSGITNLIGRWVKIKPQIIVIFLYALVIALMTVGISKYLPVIIGEISQLIKQLGTLNIKPQGSDNEMLNELIN
ncbi:MAG: AI-2E family transporter, partial [Gorillibacterium sp.]|nr:AI-2E family transporter [Gorillibacterium sp.]